MLFRSSRNTELQVLLGGAKVGIQAMLGKAELTLREILELQKGDVVRLSNAANDIVALSVDGKDRFRGQIGLRRFRKSIQITEIIDTEKDAVKRALENFEIIRREKISGVKKIIQKEQKTDEKE